MYVYTCQQIHFTANSEPNQPIIQRTGFTGNPFDIKPRRLITCLINQPRYSLAIATDTYVNQIGTSSL